MEYARNALAEYPDYFMVVLFMVASFMMVSIHDVLTNIPKNDLASLFDFSIIAVRDTSWFLQVLIAGFFIRLIAAGSKATYHSVKNINPNSIFAKFKFKY